MTDLPSGFHVGDVYCLLRGFPGEETIALIPGAPSIAGGTGGISMLDSPDGATMALQAGWLVPPEEMPAIAEEIARQAPAAADFDPQTAEFSSVQARLEFIGENGETYIVGPNDSSGLAGQMVVFSVTLNSEEKPRALSAVSGEAGFLKLVYDAELELREEAVARLEGDLATDLAALFPKPAPPDKAETGGMFGWGRKKPTPPPAPPPPTRQACAERVETAISEGRLSLTLRVTPNATDVLRDKVAASAKDMASAALFSAAGAGGGVTDLPVRVRKSDSELCTFTITRTADLGPVFAAMGAERLVRQSPVAIPSPVR